MSESPFSLPADAEGAAPAEEAARRRRTVLGLGALVAAALAAGAFVLLGGGDEDDLAVEVATPVAVAAGAEPSASPGAGAPAPGETLVVARGAGRNPFEVQLGPPVPGAGTEASSAAPSVPQTESGQGDVPPGSATVDVAVPTSAGQDPSSGGGAGTTQPARRLALVRVDGTVEDRRAVLLLDGTQHVAAVGDTVGPAEELLLLSLQQGPDDGQWTAVLQQGQGDPFDVVTGSPVALP